MRFLRRLLYAILLIVWGVGCGRQGEAPSPEPSPTASPAVRRVGQREYQVRQTFRLVNEGPAEPEKQNLWVALIQSVLPYQEVVSMQVKPSQYTSFSDELGNRYAEFDLSDHPVGETLTVEISYRLIVSELELDLSTCEGETIEAFTQPELHIESANPQVIALAEELSRGKTTACEIARAFYDYIGNNLVYSFNGRNWGAQAALGEMGADCTEYAALLVALSRAQGIPARYFEGLWYSAEGTDASARLEHAWADLYLPGIGWTPMDPTLGRSSIYRETYFARYTPDHIIVTIGASPSTLRGNSYWSHLYWRGDSTAIHLEPAQWQIELVDEPAQ